MALQIHTVLYGFNHYVIQTHSSERRGLSTALCKVVCFSGSLFFLYLIKDCFLFVVVVVLKQIAFKIQMWLMLNNRPFLGRQR